MRFPRSPPASRRTAVGQNRSLFCSAVLRTLGRLVNPRDVSDRVQVGGGSAEGRTRPSSFRSGGDFRALGQLDGGWPHETVGPIWTSLDFGPARISCGESGPRPDPLASGRNSNRSPGAPPASRASDTPHFSRLAHVERGELLGGGCESGHGRHRHACPVDRTAMIRALLAHTLDEHLEPNAPVGGAELWRGRPPGRSCARCGW